MNNYILPQKLTTFLEGRKEKLFSAYLVISPKNFFLISALLFVLSSAILQQPTVSHLTIKNKLTVATLKS